MLVYIFILNCEISCNLQPLLIFISLKIGLNIIKHKTMYYTKVFGTNITTMQYIICFHTLTYVEFTISVKFSLKLKISSFQIEMTTLTLLPWKCHKNMINVLRNQVKFSNNNIFIIKNLPFKTNNKSKRKLNGFIRKNCYRIMT